MKLSHVTVSITYREHPVKAPGKSQHCGGPPDDDNDGEGVPRLEVLVEGPHNPHHAVKADGGQRRETHHHHQHCGAQRDGEWE